MSKEIVKTNPATRLFRILEKARSIPYQIGNETTSTRIAWCKTFDIEDPQSEESFIEVFNYLIELKKLFQDVEKALAQIDGLNEELFIRPIPRLAKVIDFNNLNTSWQSYTRYLTEQDMTSLRFAENQLSQHEEFNENQISNDEIESILKELEQLYKSILNSTLPAQLKAVLLDLLQELRQSVHEYQVRGIVRLKEAITQSVGVVAVNKEDIEANKDSKEIEALGRMLVRIDKLISFAKKVQPLLETTASILPALASHIK